MLSCAGAATVAASPVFAGLPVPPGDTLAFRLIRHGNEIGRHTLTFDQQGDTLTVRIAVEARVTLLSIPIVHYTHRVVEVWQDGSIGQRDRRNRQERPA